MVYYKSKSSKGMKYPDALTFTDPVVDTDKKTVRISTDNIRKSEYLSQFRIFILHIHDVRWVYNGDGW